MKKDCFPVNSNNDRLDFAMGTPSNHRLLEVIERTFMPQHPDSAFLMLLEQENKETYPSDKCVIITCCYNEVEDRLHVTHTTDSDLDVMDYYEK